MEKYYLHLDGGQKGPFTIGKGVLGPRTRDARGDERAFAHEPLLLHEQRADSLEDALPQLGRFEPVAELQKRGGVGHGLAAEIDAGEAAHRLAVAEGVIEGLYASASHCARKESRNIRSMPAGGRPRLPAG